jgi:hypothetical protein
MAAMHEFTDTVRKADRALTDDRNSEHEL